MLDALRAGDEDAFADLVVRWTPWMLKLAATFVPSREVAEDVVQECWLAVLAGLRNFEGRASLRTWVFAIVVRRSRQTGQRERRSVPFSAVWRDDHGPAVDPARFHPRDAPAHARGWVSSPRRWELDTDSTVQSAELRGVLEDAIAALPPRQRQVVVARDVWCCGSAEVCQLLGHSANCQGVLLHRARSKLRAALEVHISERAP